MEKFRALSSKAIPLGLPNIDTDVIFPARFLLHMERRGLGRFLFNDWRFDEHGDIKTEFVLNDPRWHGASILIGGSDFGCGSSREQAVWTLLDYGIRAIIAPSFGKIFYDNCIMNGILPIQIGDAAIGPLLELATSETVFDVDLSAKILTAGDEAIPICLDESRCEALLAGWDEIDLIDVRHGPLIAAFETKHRGRFPWLFEPVQIPEDCRS